MKSSTLFRLAVRTVAHRSFAASALLLSALLAGEMSATTLQLSSVGARSSAQFMVDGTRIDARVGHFTDEGLLLEKVVDDTAVFRYNGLPQRMRVGETIVVDSQTQGFVSHQIKADQKNLYKTAALVNGGNLQAEIDRNVDIIVIPVADADRLNLPYKDKKSQLHRAPRQTTIEMKEGKEIKTVIDPKDKDGKPLMYKTYSLPLNSVRVGPIDGYGLNAIVSEKPGLTTTVIGREFLKRLAPNWSNRTLTLVRR
jgi:predicted aspartyl protease